MRPGSVLALNSTAGQFTYLIDEHREINCNMKFENYPLDEQICYFKIFSGMYPLTELVHILERTKSSEK